MRLAQALNEAATAVHMDREKSNTQFGPGLFDRAIEHHVCRNLRADIARGVTRDVDGVRARFVRWGEPDARAYIEAPHFVYFDFFSGHILNSVSRMSRALGA